MPLDTGEYLLVTGNRFEDGSVLNSLTFFQVKKDKLARVPVYMRLIPDMNTPTGKLDLNSLEISLPGHVIPQKLKHWPQAKN